jgi:hypothetical protein
MQESSLLTNSSRVVSSSTVKNPVYRKRALATMFFFLGICLILKS